MITFDFKGRHAVVTGAGGGMGEAIASMLLAAGAAVTALDIKPLPDRLAGAGDRIDYDQGDLADPAFVADSIATAGKKRGSIDYLVNVAGVLWFVSLPALKDSAPLPL